MTSLTLMTNFVWRRAVFFLDFQRRFHELQRIMYIPLLMDIILCEYLLNLISQKHCLALKFFVESQFRKSNKKNGSRELSLSYYDTRISIVFHSFLYQFYKIVIPFMNIHNCYMLLMIFSLYQCKLAIFTFYLTSMVAVVTAEMDI